MSITRTAPAFALVGIGVLIGAILGGTSSHRGGLVGTAVGQASAEAADDTSLQAKVKTLQDKATDQAHTMVSVAYHFNNLWFAAQHGNWPLAQFYLDETKSHMRWSVRVIPIRQNNAGQDVDLGIILDAVEKGPLERVDKAIKAKNREQLVIAYKGMLSACASCHKASDKPFIRTHIPTEPADPMVNFAPVAEADEKPAEFEIPAGAISGGAGRAGGELGRSQ